MRHRRTIRLASVLLLLLVVAAGCQLGESQSPECDCPNTEAIVSSIDWFGDGIAAAEMGSQEFDGVSDVGLLFDHFGTAEEASAALDGLYERLTAAGLMNPVPPGEQVGVEIELADASVTTMPPLREENSATQIGVDVGVFVDDADAAEALQPLVDALGTID